MDSANEPWRRDFGEWRPIRPIGEGGSATVLEVFHLHNGRRAALKVLHRPLSEDCRAAKRFRNEVRAIQKIKSPHVVGILASGTTSDGLGYLVTELVDGQTLAERIKQGPLAVATALTIAVQIAEALSAAHQAKIVHRDLKPANILLQGSHDDSQPWVKVIDFGVAKLLQPTDGEAHSVTTEPLGTAAYMSREQWCTPGDIDGRADLYALGVVLFECLSSTKPYCAESVHDWLCAHTQGQIPELATHLELPRGLSTLIKSLMAKDREQRPTNADAVIAALNACASAAVDSGLTPIPIEIRPSTRNSIKQSRPWAAWGATLLLVFMLGGVVSWKLPDLSEKRSVDLQSFPSELSSLPMVPLSDLGPVRLPVPMPIPVDSDVWIVIPGGRVWRYEVSRDEYREFHEQRFPGEPSPWDGITDYEGTKRFPVSLVDARDAQSYCTWKHGPGSRLLTPKEWEWVAHEARRPDPATGQSIGLLRLKLGRQFSDFVSTRDEEYAQGSIGIVHLFGNVAEFTQEQEIGTSAFWICGSSSKTAVHEQSSSEKCRRASHRANPYIGIRCMVPNPAHR